MDVAHEVPQKFVQSDPTRTSRDPNSIDLSAMSDLKSPLRDSAILLAGATAFLYCVGTAHAGGYLATLGLDADILDRNFHQVLYNGFLTAIGPALVGFLIYAGARVLYSHLVLPVLMDWLYKATANKRLFLQAKRKWAGGRKTQTAERTAKRHTLNVLRHSGFAFALILTLAHFETQGKKDALVILKRIDMHQPPPKSSLVRVKIDDTMKTLFYLSCGARNCAGMELSSKTVYYFPQNGHSYQYEEPAATYGRSPSTSPTASGSKP